MSFTWLPVGSITTAVAAVTPDMLSKVLSLTYAVCPEGIHRALADVVSSVCKHLLKSDDSF